MMTRKTAQVLITTAVLSLLALATAFALDGTQLKADVPFAFTAGEMSFPAGHYVFTVDDPNEPTLLTIESADGHRHEVMLTVAESNHAGAYDESKLVFDRYGDDNFLAEVLVAGLDQGRAVPKSERERVATKRMHREKVSLDLR